MTLMCQECNERPATVHFTTVVNGDKSDIHLCDKCAQGKGEIFMMNQPGGFSFNDLLAGLMNFDPVLQKTKSQPSPSQQLVHCEECKMTFEQFVKIGRFGCANCYKAFNEQITPIMRRLHGGNMTHGGKVPKRMGGSLHIKRKIATLKEELKELVVAEEFEKAAEIRDQIRSLENTIIQGEGNGQ